jgi:hypothetical protein
VSVSWSSPSTSTGGDLVTDLDATLEEWLDSFEHADLSGDVEMRDETRAWLEDMGYLQ